MKKILIWLIILGLIGLITINLFKDKKVNAENLQLENLIKTLFDERIDLLSSKDLDKFDEKLEKVKLSLTSLFIDNETINNSLILYRVKSKVNEIKVDIPKEWIVPNENGVWRAASSDYYTILFQKDNLNWKIKDFIRGNYANKPLFVYPKINGFSQPPDKKLPIPEEIMKEIENYSVKNFTTTKTQSICRMFVAQYADNWWNKRNTKYPDYSNVGGDCTNFVSQCLYESTAFPLDWNGSNECQKWWVFFYPPEPRNSPNYSSQSFRFCPNFECYLLNNSDFPNKGPKGWIEYQGYMKLWRGD